MTKWLAAVFVAVFLCPAFALAQDFVELPAPDKTGGKPLMQALNERKTERAMSEREIDDQTLSSLLWATWGINRDSGLRTAPTAKNVQNVSVYVEKADGIWRYDGERHGLVKVNEQGSMPLTLYYVVDERKTTPEMSAMHVGSLYQNAGLYCASVGLNNVVKATFRKDDVARALNIPGNERVYIAHPIGWPK